MKDYESIARDKKPIPEEKCKDCNNDGGRAIRFSDKKVLPTECGQCGREATKEHCDQFNSSEEKREMEPSIEEMSSEEFIGHLFYNVLGGIHANEEIDARRGILDMIADKHSPSPEAKCVHDYEQIKYCSGCGHASNVPLPKTAFACCPDHDYRPFSWFFEQIPSPEARVEKLDRKSWAIGFDDGKAEAMRISAETRVDWEEKSLDVICEIERTDTWKELWSLYYSKYHADPPIEYWKELISKALSAAFEKGREAR